MSARVLMIQGTGSDVGKSIVVAGLCRAAHRRGIDVAPFKPQNMSNNAAACPGGGEIGRAQALQALAAAVTAQTDHNPVLLKPESDTAAQVVVHGKVRSSLEARAFIDSRDTLMPAVMQSFGRLAAQHELLLVEGAGSPAEINLRQRDIANMGFARHAGVPVCLLGDIDRGGVIAALVGTHAVLDAADAAMITGFAINKFRGDPSLFEDGVTAIEERTGWPCYGVIPWLAAASKLPAEDAVSAPPRRKRGRQRIHIVAPMLSRMANFDDADPLRLEAAVDFEFISPGRPLPRAADLIVLFGSKSTLAELRFLRQQGWDHDIIAHARSGGRVLGLCGGYQMLGRSIVDASGTDGSTGIAEGLGLLDVVTHMQTEKTVRQLIGVCATSGLPIRGYEIHVGITHGEDCLRPVLRSGGIAEGARSPDGLVEGSYVHGLFADDRFRRHFLARLKKANSVDSLLDYSACIDNALDELADGLEKALDIERLFASARAPGWSPDPAQQLSLARQLQRA